MTRHTHSWKKYKDDTYYCTWPTCYSKYKLDFLIGKLAKCNHCEKEFIIYRDKLKLNTLFLNCPDCKVPDPDITIEGVRRSIIQLIREDVKNAIHEKLLRVNRRASDLAKWEKSLTAQAIRLETWEKKLEVKVIQDAQKIENKKRSILDRITRKRAKLLKLNKMPRKNTAAVDIGELMLKGVENEAARLSYPE